MTSSWQRWAWPAAKILVALAILIFVAHRFYDDLSQLDVATLDVHAGWLVVSGLLYALGLGMSAWYWYHVLRLFGDRPRLIDAGRGYFLGHLGKYVPGKALALLLRVEAVRGPDVRVGVAIITSFYEVLTTMAAGALFAALVFIFAPPQGEDLPLPPFWTGLGLLVFCGIPLLPGVFNFVVRRMAERFETVENYDLPPLRLGTLVVGLVVTGAGWGAFGLSIWALLQSVLPHAPALTIETWLHCTATIGLAYVAGFLMIFLPGGLGVRESFLLPLLLPLASAEEHPRAMIAAAVLLLRVVWTATEVLVAVMLMLLRGKQDTETRRLGDTETQDPGGQPSVPSVSVSTSP